MSLLIASSLALAFADPAAAPPAAKPAAAKPAGESASAELKDKDGKSVGTVTVHASPKGLIVRGELRGLTPGEHAIHLHEVGLCEPPFKTAGGHFNPAKKSHGVLHEKGPHAGDMPNIFANADGRATFEHHTTVATLGRGATNVLDKDGTSIVVHASADDHMTDPAGNAGDRVACGVLTKVGLAAPAPAVPAAPAK